MATSLFPLRLGADPSRSPHAAEVPIDVFVRGDIRFGDFVAVHGEQGAGFYLCQAFPHDGTGRGASGQTMADAASERERYTDPAFALHLPKFISAPVGGKPVRGVVGAVSRVSKQPREASKVVLIPVKKGLRLDQGVTPPSAFIRKELVGRALWSHPRLSAHAAACSVESLKMIDELDAEAYGEDADLDSEPEEGVFGSNPVPIPEVCSAIVEIEGLRGAIETAEAEENSEISAALAKEEERERMRKEQHLSSPAAQSRGYVFSMDNLSTSESEDGEGESLTTPVTRKGKKKRKTNKGKEGSSGKGDPDSEVVFLSALENPAEDCRAICGQVGTRVLLPLLTGEVAEFYPVFPGVRPRVPGLTGPQDDDDEDDEGVEGSESEEEDLISPNWWRVIGKDTTCKILDISCFHHLPEVDGSLQDPGPFPEYFEGLQRELGRKFGSFASNTIGGCIPWVWGVHQASGGAFSPPPLGSFKSPSTVFITGPSGVGKSAFVGEMAVAMQCAVLPFWGSGSGIPEAPLVATTLRTAEEILSVCRDVPAPGVLIPVDSDVLSDPKAVLALQAVQRYADEVAEEWGRWTSEASKCDSGLVPKPPVLIVITGTKREEIVVSRVGSTALHIDAALPSPEHRLRVIQGFLSAFEGRGVDVGAVSDPPPPNGASGLASVTGGFTPSDLQSLLNTAVGRALERSLAATGPPCVTQGDLDDARRLFPHPAALRRFTTLRGGPGLSGVVDGPWKEEIRGRFVVPFMGLGGRGDMIAPPPTTLIVTGATGCGKTALMEASVRECEANTLVVWSRDVTTAAVGEGNKRLRELFAVAVDSAPCVIVWDDLHSFVGASYSRNPLSQVLTLVDDLARHNEEVAASFRGSAAGIVRPPYVTLATSVDEDIGLPSALLSASRCTTVRRGALPLLPSLSDDTYPLRGLIQSALPKDPSVTKCSADEIAGCLHANVNCQQEQEPVSLALILTWINRSKLAAIEADSSVLEISHFQSSVKDCFSSSILLD